MTEEQKHALISKTFYAACREADAQERSRTDAQQYALYKMQVLYTENPMFGGAVHLEDNQTILLNYYLTSDPSDKRRLVHKSRTGMIHLDHTSEVESG
jgi:hypothetical protein